MASRPRSVKASKAADHELIFGDLGQADWVNPEAVLGALENASPQLRALSVGAVAQIQALLETQQKLVQQAAVLEDQVTKLLAERSKLLARIATLEEQAQDTSAPRVPGSADRPPTLLRARSTRNAVSQNTPLAQPLAHPLERWLVQTAAPVDEAVLRTLPPANTHAAADLPADSAIAGQAGVPLQGFTLIAQPFGHFNDLEVFQVAVQSLVGVQNVRVRRFVQGTLELRADYAGTDTLINAVRQMVAVDVAEQEAPDRIIIRLVQKQATGTMPC